MCLILLWSPVAEDLLRLDTVAMVAKREEQKENRHLVDCPSLAIWTVRRYPAFSQRVA